MWPQVKECQQSPEARRGQECILSYSLGREYSLASTLILTQWNWLWPSEIGAELWLGGQRKDRKRQDRKRHLWTGVQDILGAGKGVIHWGHPDYVFPYYYGDFRGCGLRDVFEFLLLTEKCTEIILHQKEREGHVSLIFAATSLPWHSSPHCCWSEEQHLMVGKSSAYVEDRSEI